MGSPDADGLVAWLRQQLDEDERVALAVPEGDRVWDYTPGAESVTATDHRYPSGMSYVACGPWDGGVNEQYAAHIASWDPVRVLAEVAAKRQILDRYETACADWKRTVVAEHTFIRDCEGGPYRASCQEPYMTCTWETDGGERVVEESAYDHVAAAHPDLFGRDPGSCPALLRPSRVA